jgi:hypothetical protein
MQGKQDRAWTQSTIQPTRYRFPSPVTTFIKFLLKTVKTVNTLRTGDADLRLYTYKQFKYPVPNVLSWNILAFPVTTTIYSSYKYDGV